MQGSYVINIFVLKTFIQLQTSYIVLILLLAIVYSFFSHDIKQRLNHYHYMSLGYPRFITASLTKNNKNFWRGI